MAMPATGERRRYARQKSLLRGRIIFNNHATVIDCLVRDISEGGARLVFSDAVQTPDVFKLHIPAKEQTLVAHVHWRHGEDVGVSFAQAMRVPPPGTRVRNSRVSDRVARLEAEIVALKRVLKKLKADIRGSDTDAA